MHTYPDTGLYELNTRLQRAASVICVNPVLGRNVLRNGHSPFCHILCGRQRRGVTGEVTRERLSGACETATQQTSRPKHSVGQRLGRNACWQLARRNRHLKKDGSRTKRTPFFTCIATCRFPGCHRYRLAIRDPLGTGCQTTIRCRVFGSASASHGSYYAHRHLSGERRRATAVLVERQGAYLTRQQMLQQAPDAYLSDGNITQAPPAAVLRQAAYERRASERYSTDWSDDGWSRPVSRTMDGAEPWPRRWRCRVSRTG